VIAVRVDNSQQPNSRWYSGCGIYRNVWLTITSPVYVDHWGTYVTTPEIKQDCATVNVLTKIKNETPETATIQLKTSIKNREGKTVSSEISEEQLNAGSAKEVTHQIALSKPELWTIENPYLYTIVTEILQEQKEIDQYETPLGIRSFSFDPDKGFFLNNKPIKIKGVCMHNDLGCLGAAVNTRAIERQLELLKEMGVNGIRCAHNPPAPELLQLCDKMGFIVMNETFDMWRKRKTTYDYSLYFNEWHERDLTDHILRDRNHPSVFMWSIGNEVMEQWTHADADTLNIQQANLLLNLERDEKSLSHTNEISVNSLLTQKLAGIVKKLDPTRPITTGNNEPNSLNHLFRADTLDIIGFNYHLSDFEHVKDNFPGKPFIATETTSALATRGYYRMPSDSLFIWPIRWDTTFYDSTYSCSAYDNCHVPWGSTHEETWRKVKNNDFVSGLYIWTGFDYIGEPTPYQFPARSSYFGIIDLAGIPKDAFYFYQSEWTEKPMLHIFPHWNWTEKQPVDIWAYFNQADEAELFLNGVSQGVKKKEQDIFHVAWRVNFQPGTIRVITRKNGKEVVSKELQTAGEPYGIKLTPDRNIIAADGKDLCFILVEIVDKNGNLCPNADNLIHFEISGDGRMVGVDNGNQTSMESFKVPYRKAFHGKCIVVIQSEKKKGKIEIKAVSQNLQTLSINMKAQ
jgi:beta-galactosidase